MKKIYVLFIVLCGGISASHAQITDIEEDYVMCSENFENDTPGINFVTEGAPLAISNDLGGTSDFSWAQWQGALVNSDHSAKGGSQCLQTHWGGILYVDGFTMNSSEIYQLEVMVHPPTGKNKWGAIHLMAKESTVLWQTQGFRIRCHNGNEDGNFPNFCLVDHWLGENGEEAKDTVFDFRSNATDIYQDGANEGDFWIPLKLIFTGEGTTDSPFKIDYYFNNVLRASQEYDNVVFQGDRMIGLANNGNDGEENAMWDNFKLTKMKKVVTSINVKDIINDCKVYPTVTSDYITLELGNYLKFETRYQLYGLSGQILKEGRVTSEKQRVSVDKLEPSMYMIKIIQNDLRTKMYKIVKR